MSHGEVYKLARIFDNPMQVWTELQQTKYLRTDVAEYKVQHLPPTPATHQPAMTNKPLDRNGKG